MSEELDSTPQLAPSTVTPRPWRRRAHALAGRLLILRERLVPRPRRFALVLSHMRSGSSLLHHLLLQHPAAAGAGERNRPYSSPQDLDRLVADAYIAQRRFVRRAAIFVDQINHDGPAGEALLLARSDVDVIFLVRRPEAAIASMVDVLGRHYGFTEAQAVHYYDQRLTGLLRLAHALPAGGALAIHYEALVEDPPRVLRALERHLALPPPRLEAHYPSHRFTGGAGDPSPLIHRGQVVDRTARRRELLPDLRAHLEGSYEVLNRYFEARFEVVAYDPS